MGGDFEHTPLLLLHTRGARTGQERIHPLAYLGDGARRYVFASRGGSPRNPGWYYNLLANPDVVVELGGETFDARATVLEGAERERIFAEQAARTPVFADYARNAGRVIPVVALDRVPA